MPQYDEMMPASAESSLMTGLPGFPQTDEEERAIGLRRPAYIPATSPKRKRKLSSGRVISGVLSILLVTVGACAALGFLGQQQLARLFSGPFKVVVAQPTPDMSLIPVTPVSTPGPSAKIITSVVTAQSIDKDYNPIDITSYFKVNSMIYAVVNIVGASQNTTNTLTCVWYINGVNFNLKSSTSVTVQPSKSNNFHGYCGLQYYQTGTGMVKVYWDRPSADTSESATDKYLAQTIRFGVFATLPGTVTPASGTPKPGAPTPSPTKKASGVGLPVAWRPESGAS